MSSSTRQALSAAREFLAPLLTDADLRLAEELFAVSQAVSDSKQLRSILSDPSAEIAGKKAALAAVFGKSLSSKSVEFLGSVVGLRWSTGQDLVRALEQLAVQTVAAIAARGSSLEALEAELFAFQKVVDSDQQLQIALASRQAEVELKIGLVESLLAGKFSPEASLLIRFAVIGSAKRRLSVVLEQFARLISAYAGKLVATVTVAAELSENQQASLAKTLARDYGNSLTLNIEVDPAILGGIKVQVAGEVIDGSVANRLKQARMMLA
jgi:F-type H+-transporting ATPase subunit delta